MHAHVIHVVRIVYAAMLAAATNAAVLLDARAIHKVAACASIMCRAFVAINRAEEMLPVESSVTTYPNATAHHPIRTEIHIMNVSRSIPSNL